MLLGSIWESATLLYVDYTSLFIIAFWRAFPANIYLFKVNKRNTRKSVKNISGRAGSKISKWKTQIS